MRFSLRAGKKYIKQTMKEKCRIIRQNEFGERVSEIYESLEYNVIEVPFILIEKHAIFILDKIKAIFY
jgi:predicted ATPase